MRKKKDTVVVENVINAEDNKEKYATTSDKTPDCKSDFFDEELFTGDPVQEVSSEKTITEKVTKVDNKNNIASVSESDFMQQGAALFEKEVNWCIHQLELGLRRADAEQAKESKAVIEKLRSPKRTIVQKRHLMRVVFGDYRKLIQEEQRQQEKDAKNN